MTAPFMSATPLSTAPFLTIERKTDALSPGTPVPFRPGLAGAPKKVKFNQDLNMMVMASEFRRVDIGGLGNGSYLFKGPLSFAPDDDYILSNGIGSELPKLVRRQGPYYLPATGLPLPTVVGQTLVCAAISKNAKYIAFVLSTSPTLIRVHTKATDAQGLDTWTEVQQITTTTGMLSMKISDDGKYIFAYRLATTGGSLFYRAATAFAAVAFGAALFDCVFPATGGAVICGTSSLAAGGNLVSADVAAGVTTARLAFANPAGALPGKATISPNGKVIGWLGASFLRIVYWTGSAWTAVNSQDLSVGNGVDPDPSWSNNGLFFVWGRKIGATAGTGNTREVRKLDSATVPTTTTQFMITSPTNGNAQFIAQRAGKFIWSTDDSVLSTYADSGDLFVPIDSRPMGGAASPAAITTLPFFGATLFSTMKNLAYGRTQRFAATATDSYAAPSWSQFSVRDGAGDYFSMATLEGTFVSVYDIATDGTGAFVERDFYQHIVGSVVSDMVISLNNNCVVYDIRRTDAGVSGLGRYVFDLTDVKKMVYRGVIQLANDISTLAAFSVESLYMALSVRNSGGNNLKLYKFNADYSFVLKDTDLEDYGPPAWSHCDTVIVAHGGVQPYSLYQHVLSPDTLVEQPIAISNWDNQSQIVFVAVTPDCAGVIVLDEDDNVTTISDGAVVDSDNGGLGSSGGSGGGAGGPSAGSGGGGGSTDINWPGGSISVDNTTKGITNLIYIDYNASSVTPRTWL